VKHTLYKKATGEIIAEVRGSRSTGALQETADVGVLVGTPCPANPAEWLVVDGVEEPTVPDPTPEPPPPPEPEPEGLDKPKKHLKKKP